MQDSSSQGLEFDIPALVTQPEEQAALKRSLPNVIKGGNFEETETQCQ